MTPARLLVVEDEAIIAADVQGQLVKAGYTVLGVAGAGEEAVRLTETLKPDAVLMDIGLGGALDGIAAAAALRARQNVPVIFLTAHSDPATLERAKAVEPAGFLTKPFQLASLVATVEVALYKNQMEARLRASEARYHAVLEQVFDGMMLVEAETGKVLEVNAAAERLLGYPRVQLVHQPIFSLVPFRHSSAVTIAFQGLLRSGHYHVSERHYHRPDGAEVVLDIYATVIRYHDQQVVCVTLHDITERYRVEQALKESEARFRRLADNAPDIIFRYNFIPAMGLAYINAAVETITGYTPDDCYADPMLMLNMTHPDDAAIMREYLQTLYVPREPLLLRWIGKDGVTRWMESRLVSVYDAEGQLVAVEGVTRDVSERLRYEQALRESEARYRLIADHMTDVVWLMDMDFNQTYVSPSVERVSGFTLAELKGMTLGQRMTPASAQYVQALWAEMKANLERPASPPQITRTLEVEYYRKDGSTYWGEIIATLLRDAEGRPTGLLGVTRDVSERKHMEDALRASELKYSIVAHHTADWEYWVDPDGAMLYTSPSCEAVTGYSAQDFMTRHNLFLDIIHPADHAVVDRHREILEPDRTEFRIIRADGQVRWVDHVCQRVYDADGKHIGRRASNRDITERKHAEAQLQEQRDFALSVMNTMGQGLTVTDEHVRFEYVNPAYAHFVGYRPEDLIGRSPGDLTYEPSQTVLEQAWADRRLGKTTTYETQLVRADGSLVDVLITGVPRWRQGRICGSIAVVTDLTERKRTERALAEEHGRLRALFEASRDGLVLVGMDLPIHLINHHALEYLGLPGQPEDWVGRSFAELLEVLGDQQAVPPTVNQEYHRIVRGDEPPGEGEWAMSRRVLHWLNLPVLAQTKILGRLIVVRDITQERQVEKLRDDLTRTMVHDLRNPLTSLRGAVQLIELDGLAAFTADQREMLDVIYSGIGSMLELVAAILDVSQLESGQMPVRRVPVALASLVREVLRLEGPLAAQKPLTLIATVPETLPMVMGDPQLLQRVVQNLVGNALKFTPGGGAVQVTATVGEHDVRVAVSDTGPGIAPDLQAHLFQKFVTGRVPGHGSGLGLALCRLVVEAHDGRIWVESTPGQGATFYFSLPVG